MHGLPASRFQLLLTNLLLVLAVALAWNRGQLFPAWLRAEAYHVDAWGIVRLYELTGSNVVDQANIKGRPTLLVADSQGWGCKWDVDLVSLAGASSPRLADMYILDLGRRRYAQVVFFTGSAGLAGGDSVTDYVESVIRMVRVAMRTGAQVFVVSPMPYDFGEGGGPDYVVREETYTQVAAAVAALRAGLPPEVFVYDLRGFRQSAPRQAFMTDNIHLTPYGYDLLGNDLAQAGLTLPEG